LKSHVSELLEMLTIIYIDAISECRAITSDLRDLTTVRSRVENEGISFLTITLPSFADDFIRSLANGRVDSTAFRSFRKAGAIPAFLQGMTSLIFNRETGEIYNESPTSFDRDIPTIIKCVRQICLAFKKLELECTPSRVNASLEGFVATEHELSDFEAQGGNNDDNFRRVARLLWDNAFSDFNLENLAPKHGPGATADGISGNQKYRWLRWHDRLEPYFHLLGDGYSISAFDSDEFRDVTVVDPVQELPVKVTPVPKSQKGPRIIAIEPVCMQYAQQALMSYLVGKIQSSDMSGGHVNFTDQSVNQRLALIASRKDLCHLATIDLSEASDRVPLSLAADMFSNVDLRDSILACRSTHAKLPTGQLIGPLKKFASMGSALCFPVESMFFYTICVGTILREQNLPYTLSGARKAARQVYVYGDDIIVPVEHALAICDDLQKNNCKVNTRKSFWSGCFRESCGVEAYDGEEITPLYIRQLPPSDRRQATSILSWTATASLFYKRGMWKIADHMYKRVESLLGSLPYLSEESSGLGRRTIQEFRTIERWNRNLHRFEVKAWVPEPVYRTDRLEGYGALQKFFLEGGDEFSFTPVSKRKDHLERSARFGTVTLKRRWVSSY